MLTVADQTPSSRGGEPRVEALLNYIDLFVKLAIVAQSTLDVCVCLM